MYGGKVFIQLIHILLLDKPAENHSTDDAALFGTLAHTLRSQLALFKKPKPLNKSPPLASGLRGMGCAKGDDAIGAIAKGRAVSSEGRCDPAAGCKRPNRFFARS